jgi:hypothetical protein
VLLTSIMFTIVPAAAVVSHVNNVPVVLGLLACCMMPALLQYFCKHLRFCWRRLYCFGGPEAACIPAVACDPVVVGGHNFAVIPAVAYCCHHCCACGATAVACIPALAGVPRS